MNIGKDNSGRIIVSFRYNPDFVTKVKTIPRHKWNPKEKLWSFPDSDGTLDKILKVFEGEDIRIDPALQAQLPHPVIARSEATKQSQEKPSLAKPSPEFVS